MARQGGKLSYPILHSNASVIDVQSDTYALNQHFFGGSFALFSDFDLGFSRLRKSLPQRSGHE